MIGRLRLEARSLQLHPGIWWATLGIALCAAAWPFMPGPWPNCAWLLGFFIFNLCCMEGRDIARAYNFRKYGRGFVLGPLVPILGDSPARNRVALLVLTLWACLFLSCPLPALLR